MKCPRCKKEIKAGESQCGNCGFIPAAQQPPARVIAVKCPCGVKVRSSKLFCGRCGQLLPVPNGSRYADEYVIKKIVGQGAMGRVYRAEDRGGTAVAIKEMLDVQTWSQQERSPYLGAFTREAELLGALRQLRSVPRLIDGPKKWSGRHYFVMEYIEGTDLETELERHGRPFPVEVVVRWAIQLCELLELLHSQRPSIIHQDLKLLNILLRQPATRTQDIVLLDFGIARFVRPGTQLTPAGTPGYAPPEQLQSNPRPEPRSDLYSLAVCMHQLLTGADPAKVAPHFPPARQLNRQVPAWLSELIAINLNQDAHARYESAAALRRDLEEETASSQIRCRVCNRENSRDLIYCARCLSVLFPEPAKECKRCSTMMPSNANYCSNCGETL